MNGNDVETVNSLPILVDQEHKPKPLRKLFDSSRPIDDLTAIETIIRWRYERKKYPGWLIPTSEMRDSLWRNTSVYVQKLLPVIKDWPYEDQILLYREIIWRVDISLLPLDSKLAELLEPVVDELFSMLIDKPRLKPSRRTTMLLDVSDTDVHESWLESTLALMREARESFDRERCEVLRKMVSQLIDSHPQYNDRFSYEQVLWHLWNLDRNEARNLLTRWSPSPNAPLDLMRKAGLLVELDDLNEAHSLLRTALKNIRQSFYRKPGLNIDLLSLEGWCMYLLLPIESSFDIFGTTQESQDQDFQTAFSKTRQQFLKRWDELKAWDCDPWSCIEHFRQTLSGESPTAKKVERIVPGFDIGHYNVSHSFVDTPDTRRLPAYSFLRLHDVVGIPLRFSNEPLQNVAEWLTPSSSFLSPMILIRAGNSREIEKRDFMNRTQIASMDTDLARRLHTWAMNALEREVSSLEEVIPMESIQASLFETLIEFMSRLTIKADNAALQSAFNMALHLHNQPGFKSHIRLNRFCYRWFTRLFDAARSQQLLTWIPTLLRFPLSMGSNEPEVSRHPAFSWPDPMIDFPCDSVRDIQEINPSLKTEINEAIDLLLLNTQTSMGETRQRALVRLYLVFHSNLMTEKQSEQFGDLLWEDSIKTGFPNLPDITLFNYLHLPSPPEIDITSNLKQYLLSLKPKKSVSFDESRISVHAPGVGQEDQMIHDASNMSHPVVLLPEEAQGKIEWSLSEAKEMWKDVYEWWNNDKHAIRHAVKHSSQPSIHILDYASYARHTTARIGQFLARVVLPHLDSSHEEEWSQILSFLSETREDEIYLTTSLPYILLHRTDEYDMVLKTIQDDLSSNDEEKVKAAAAAISHWAYLGDEQQATHPPPKLIDDLVKRVVFRRPEGVESCLWHLAIIIRNKPDQIDSNQIQLISYSLIPWLQTVHIPISERNIAGFPEHEIPLLRAKLGNLAIALREWLKSDQSDQPEPTEISDLLELFKSDPLPEVRRSVGIY